MRRCGAEYTFVKTAPDFEWRCKNEGPMNANQEATANKITESLLALPWQEREDVIHAVRFNNIFCWHCGYGSRETPNPDCQCWNDE